MKARSKTEGSSVTVHVPIALRARGCRKVVVSPDGNTSWQAPVRPRVDNTLLRAVVQAFHWKSQIEAGQFATVSELAVGEGLNGSYVSHVLRLTLLAPDLVEAILQGQQPAQVQLQSLVRTVPELWDMQRRSWA